jgi:excisionase family DNA binding protein
MKKHEYYLAQELADKLRVNIMTIYRYIKAGKLKACKFGGEFRIEKREFDRLANKSIVRPYRRKACRIY